MNLMNKILRGGFGLIVLLAAAGLYFREVTYVVNAAILLVTGAALMASAAWGKAFDGKLEESDFIFGIQVGFGLIVIGAGVWQMFGLNLWDWAQNLSIIVVSLVGVFLLFRGVLLE